MKNLKKMLVAICILAVLCTGVIMTVIAETGPTGSVSEAQALLDAVAAAEDLGAKRTAMDELDAYMNGNTFDTEAEDYLAFIAAYEEAEIGLRIGEIDAKVQAAEAEGTKAAKEKALAALAERPVSNAKLEEAGILDEIDTYKFTFANELLAAVGMDVNGDTAANRTKLNKLNAFIRVNPLNEEHADYEAFNTEHLEKVKEHEDATKAAFEALEGNALPSNYDLHDLIHWDMESEATSPKFVDGDTTDGGQVILNKNPNSAASHVTEANGNTYYRLDYARTGSGNGRHMYLTTLGSTPSDSKGLVFEFDVLIENDIPGKFRLEGGQNCEICEARDFWCMIAIENDGSVRCGYDKNTNPLIPNVVVKGEWTRFTVVFDKETYTADVYVDYTLIGSGEIRKDQGAAEDHRHEYTVGFPRLGVDPSESRGSIGVDNFKVYAGTSVRTLDRIDNMTDVERAEYFVDYFTDADRPVTERLLSYNRAGEVLANYLTNPDGIIGNEDDVWNLDGLDTEAADAIEALATTYWEYNMDHVIAALKLENLEEYVQMETKASALPRDLTTKSMSDRQDALKAIAAFLAECGEYIDIEDARYIQTESKVSIIQAKLTADRDILSFNKHIERFNYAVSISSLAAMKKHYAAAEAAYENFNGYALEVLEEGYEQKDKYNSFASAVERYLSAQAEINEAIKDDTSKKIIDCVSFISEFKTQAEWDANYAYIERYVLIIRETIYEDNYTKDYEGLEEAIAVFNPINDYFYNNLQLAHIAELTRCVEKYAGSDSYIERVGLVSYIEKYLATNDIDEENEAIANLIVAFKTYKNEIGIQEENYADLLDQNTVYFVNFVEELKTCVDYASMKEVYEKAEIYYYSMNVSADYVQDAVVTFDEYTVILETLEESTALFVGYAKQISGASGDELYTVLVNCCRYADGVEVTISDEAAEMYEAFNEAYELYVSVTDAANSEIEETVIAMGSARANSGIAPIISVMIGMII